MSTSNSNPGFTDETGLSDLTDRYTTLLLNSERQAANDLIMQAIDGGIPVKDIYLKVFQPALYEIGRLWQANKISVAQEHFCTAATQLIMSQLYPAIFNSNKTGKRLVATCVGGELHEIGVRMVADFFEMEGWDTYYIGANSPADSILQSLESMKADLLAISASMTFNVGTVKKLISAIKTTEVGAAVTIMVGGRPFNIATDLWKEVQADCYAPDPPTAITTANSFFKDSL